jgi:hypothetical protein
LLSCVVSYDVQIDQNGSANVQQSHISSPNERRIESYKNSELISEFTTSVIKDSDYILMNFKIETVDSLGTYLTFFKPDFVSFSKNQNELIISTSGSEPFVRDSGFGLHMRIEFDQEIKDVVSNEIKVKKEGVNAIIINQSRRHLRNKGRPTEIKVILE